MAVFEYKGHQFEADENMSEADWAQTTAYLDSLPASKPLPDESLISQIPTDGPATTVKPLTTSESLLETAKGIGSDYLEDVKKVGPLQAPINAIGEGALTLASGIVSLLGGYIQAANKAVGNLIEGKPQEGFQAPFMEGMESLTYTPKTKLGTRLNEDVITPLMTDVMMPLAGHGEMMGGHISQRALANVEKNLKSPTPEAIRQGHTVTNELLAERALPQIEKRIDTLKQEAQRLNDEGIFDEYVTNRLQEIEISLLEQEVMKTELKNMRPEKDQALVEKALELRAKIEELKARRKESRAPTEEQSIEIADERAVSKPVEVPRTPEEIIAEARASVKEPKTTPTEVALTKIAEALEASDVEIVAKIKNTFSKLDTLRESAKVNALQDIEVMQQILELRKKDPGKKVTVDDLDLSWFEGKNTETPTTEGISVENRPSIFKSETEALDSGYIDGLSKTIDEFKPYKQEMENLKETHNPTIEQSLRLQELEDIYNKLLLKNDPVNEYHGIRNTYVEELQLLKDLEKSDPEYVKLRRPIVEDMLTKLDKYKNRVESTENTSIPKIDVEEIHPTEAIVETNKPVFNSISDIYAHGEMEVMPHLLENRDQFFNRVHEKQIFFDKSFQDSVFGKMAQKVLTHFAEITGLSEDGLYISFDSSLGDKVGNVYHTGDVSHIRLNPLKIEKLSKPIKGTDFGFLKGKALENARTAYTVVRVGAHEIGHVLLNKYVQKSVLDYTNFDKTISDFNTYLKDNTPTNISVVDFWRGAKSAEGYVLMQNHFHEYFAERVANQLLSRHALGAFSKGRGKTFQALMDASVKYLQEHGVKVDKQAFIDDTITNIIEFNKITIQKGGETLWENLDRVTNDLVLDGKLVPGEFFGKSLEEVLADKRVRDIIPDRNPFLGLDTNDTPSVSRKMLNSLSKAARKVHREFFNRNNIADFDPRDPKVSGAYKKMRDIDIEIEGYLSDMLYDQQSIQGMKWTSTFSKVKNATSVYMTLRKMTDLDAAAIHEVFQKGFDEGLEYGENLAKNGQHLNPKQQQYYGTLSKLYEKMFDISEKVETDLGKKSVISKRAGWFPSSRVGNFAVTINYGSLVAHRQQFRTKLQAELFRKKLMESPITEFQISDVIDMKQGDKVLGNMEIAQNLADSFARLFPKAEDLLLDKSDKILEAYITRGGKLGHHHEFRFNVSGYKGSEFFKTPEELGHSFKEAIEQAISEKGMQIRSMKYRQMFGEFLESPYFKEKSPNSYDAIKQMYDNSLNRNVDYVEQLGGELGYQVDKAANEILGWFGKEKKTDKSINEITLQGIRDTFTTFFMTAKPLFILAQVLSVPPMTIAKMSYTHPFMSYVNFTMGMFKLMSGNKQMWDTIKEVARTTNTFDAQFMESFALQRSNKPVVEALKDCVLLQAPGRGAESLSRIMAFAAFYEQYRDVNTAIRLTGDTLTLYDKANSPAFFSHMGFVGDAMKPLQSYGQNLLGNVLGMVRYMNPKDVKTYMPMINFAILTIAVSGVQGLPFIQEYEALRRFLQKFGNYDLPSIFDIAYSKDGILKDNVSQEMADALMLGSGSLTGIDLASSARPNKSLPANLLGMMTGDVAPSDMMPLHKWAASVPGAVVDIGKGIADNAKTAEVRKAFDTVAPGGPLGYGIKEVSGLNETTIFGKNTGQKMIGRKGEADSKRTDLDKVAGMLGGKTTEQRMKELVNFNVTSREKVRQTRIDDAAIKFVETKNPKHLQTLVDIGATEKEILSKIDQEIYNRLVPLDVRMIFNKQGKPIQGRGTRAATGLFKFKRE